MRNNVRAEIDKDPQKICGMKRFHVRVARIRARLRLIAMPYLAQ
jgi:hypothetical protein